MTLAMLACLLAVGPTLAPAYHAQDCCQEGAFALVWIGDAGQPCQTLAGSVLFLGDDIEQHDIAWSDSKETWRTFAWLWHCRRPDKSGVVVSRHQCYSSDEPNGYARGRDAAIRSVLRTWRER